MFVSASVCTTFSGLARRSFVGPQRPWYSAYMSVKLNRQKIISFTARLFSQPTIIGGKSWLLPGWYWTWVKGWVVEIQYNITLYYNIILKISIRLYNFVSYYSQHADVYVSSFSKRMQRIKYLINQINVKGIGMKCMSHIHGRPWFIFYFMLAI